MKTLEQFNSFSCTVQAMNSFFFLLHLFLKKNPVPRKTEKAMASGSSSGSKSDKKNPCEILCAFIQDERISMDSHLEIVQHLIKDSIKMGQKSIQNLYDILVVCFEVKNDTAMYVGKELAHFLANKRKRETVSRQSKESTVQGKKGWPKGIPRMTKPADICECIVTKPEKYSGDTLLRARLYLKQVRKQVAPTEINEILSNFEYDPSLPLNRTPATPACRKRIRYGIDERDEDDDYGDDLDNV